MGEYSWPEMKVKQGQESNWVTLALQHEKEF